MTRAHHLALEFHIVFARSRYLKDQCAAPVISPRSILLFFHLSPLAHFLFNVIFFSNKNQLSLTTVKFSIADEVWYCLFTHTLPRGLVFVLVAHYL